MIETQKSELQSETNLRYACPTGAPGGQDVLLNFHRQPALAASHLSPFATFAITTKPMFKKFLTISAAFACFTAATIAQDTTLSNPVIPDPIATATPFNFATIIAIIGAVVILARLIVKLTPTPADDTFLEKVVTFLKHVGLNIKTILLIGFVSSCLCGSTLVLTGCSSPQRVTYQVAAATQITVEEAMTAWNLYVGQFHPSAETEQRVKDAYEKYQLAMATVCDAGAIYSAAAQSNATNTAALAAALDEARTNSTNTLADLIALLRTLGVKL